MDVHLNGRSLKETRLWTQAHVLDLIILIENGHMI